MASIVQFPASDRWLFSVDVFRRPDGSLVARFSDAALSVIESEPRETHLKLATLANDLYVAADAMLKEAENFAPPEETGQ